jgi:hypothetical protein
MRLVGIAGAVAILAHHFAMPATGATAVGNAEFLTLAAPASDLHFGFLALELAHLAAVRGRAAMTAVASVLASRRGVSR